MSAIKELVPSWESKIEGSDSYVAHVSLDNGESSDNDEEREEWMLVTALNFQVENEHAQSFIPPEGYWSNYRNYYRAKQRVEMPSWIAEMKKRRNSDRSISVRVIYVTTLNELQYLTYKIVKDNFTISNEIQNEKPLFFVC